MILAERKKSNPAIAAAIILIGFGVLAYFVPSIMLALGERSQIGDHFPDCFRSGLLRHFLAALAPPEQGLTNQRSAEQKRTCQRDEQGGGNFDCRL